MVRFPNCRCLMFAALMSWVTISSGCGAKAVGEPPEKTTKTVPVKTVAVATQDVRRTSTQPATIHGYYRAEIRAKVSGYIAAIHADIGDVVEEGTPLAEIAVPEMQKQLQIIEARLVRAKAEETRATAGIALAKANVESAEAGLVQAQSELKRADASLAAAEAEFSRTQDLVERQSLQNRVLDEVRKRRDSELANRDAVNSAINSARAKVTVSQAELTSAEADLEAAKAETTIAEKQLEEIQVLIDYATLKAPFAGLVTHRAIDPGDLVRESSEVGEGSPLFVVTQVDPVRVRVPVPEVDAAFVNRGDKMTLRFPSFAGEESITAEVSRLAGDLDPNTRTMLVEAELQNPDGKFLPGMFGEATITLSTKVAANMLPARAVRFAETGEAYVYVVGDDQTVSVQEVQTGIDMGHSIEILSGVVAGQMVIDAHLQRFTDGQTVQPLPAN
ncbi:efflux RND transporter periplasmic adaptor subunit [Thalassoroseus pseudoceratinae]|uniref:efflux RND transporter periplasmic adaptor subunit n=1 Tax=Thalassoroseus pseudoceratinae TaxID=2713176 RepID=UPI00141FCE22|nr:efflux RND transporter periplasmic adaptor subunit [Thalassoroseus pseudoceratinae]